MNKRIILVHPPMYLKSIYGELAEAGSELPPQGLCLLAAVLRKKGFNPIIIDATAEKLTLKQTFIRIKENLPACFVGFSLYYVAEKAVSQLSKWLKKLDPNIVIIVGGGHVTVSAKKIIDHYKEFDIAVIGEAELTIIDLALALNHKKNLKTIKGIIYRKKNKIFTTPSQPFIKNLDILPFPAWDLLPDLTKYYIPAGDSLKRWPSTGLVTSRGCPGNCFFCNKNAFGNKIRQNSPEYVLREIEDLIERFGIKDIYFQDDTFVANRHWLIKFCRLLIKKDLDLSWACHARTNLVDITILKLMKKAGCWQVSFGIESGSQQVLNAINKQTTVEQNKRALKMCQQAGLSVKGLFMIGSFTETKQTLAATKKFIKENYITDFHATFFTVVPGTTADKIYYKYGKITQSKIPPVTVKPSFIPFGLTKKLLIKNHKDLYRSFYMRPKIWYYFLKKLKDSYMRKKILNSSFALLKYVFLKK